MDFRIPILGFVVGLLVGLTGMGGGALMTPALILLRIGAAHHRRRHGPGLGNFDQKRSVHLSHCRQKTVDFIIVKRLAIGSIPGALVGLAVLAALHKHGDQAMDRAIVHLLAIALMCVALSLFVRTVRGRVAPVETLRDSSYTVPRLVDFSLGCCRRVPGQSHFGWQRKPHRSLPGSPVSAGDDEANCRIRYSSRPVAGGSFCLGSPGPGKH